MPPIALPRAAVLAFSLAALAAAAQTPAPKPPPKPQGGTAAKPADAPTRSLGGGTGSGKILTRDELRACMKQQESLAGRRTEVEAARAPIDRDKDALVVEQDALKGEREKVEAARKAVSELNTRYKAYADRVEAWNTRAKAVQGSSAGMQAERERAWLDNERAELQKLQGSLESERKTVSDNAQATVNTFNARAQALDQKVADWNRRNAEHTERVAALNRERETWITDCAERRYREDDEIAIREGK